MSESTATAFVLYQDGERVQWAPEFASEEEAWAWVRSTDDANWEGRLRVWAE